MINLKTAHTTITSLRSELEQAEAERDRQYDQNIEQIKRMAELEERIEELEGEMRKAIEATEFQCSERPPCGQEDCPACAIAHFMKQALKRKK